MRDKKYIHPLELTSSALLKSLELTPTNSCVTSGISFWEVVQKCFTGTMRLIKRDQLSKYVDGGKREMEESTKSKSPSKAMDVGTSCEDK